MTVVLDRPVEASVEAPARPAPRTSEYPVIANVPMPQLDAVGQRLLEAADLLELEGFIQRHYVITPAIQEQQRRNLAVLGMKLAALGMAPDVDEFIDGCGRCTVGAVLKMNENGAFAYWIKDEIGQKALIRLANHLGLYFEEGGNEVMIAVSSWSEKVGRTREEVTVALREAAFAS